MSKENQTKTCRVRTQQKGVLLIEVLLTITILSVGLTVVIRSLIASFRATSYTANYSTVIILLEDKMFDVLMESETSEGSVFSTSMNEKQSFDEPFENFSVVLEQNPVQKDGEESHLNEVLIDVGWKSGRRENRIQATTYIYQKPTDE